MTAELEDQSGKTIKVLQFTDMHFFKDSTGKLLGIETAASFAEVYRAASASYGNPDLYLLTGDLSQDETEESYRHFAGVMQNAGAPCYFLPGNHDRMPEMARGLTANGSPFFSERQIIKNNWQIILLDSHIEGEIGGHLSEKEFEFLHKCLSSEPQLFALVCLHHHPVKTGARWLDQIGVDNGDELLRILSLYKNVKGILWGHVHQEFEQNQSEWLMMATPSTCIQFKAGTEDFGVDAVPPGYRFLELAPSGLIRTAVVRLDRVSLDLELSSAGY